MNHELYQTRVLITREKKQANKLINAVTARGGCPIVAPLLQITTQQHRQQLTMIKHIQDYEWVFFTSVNGVHGFFRLMRQINLSSQALMHVKWACVGEKTADELAKYGCEVDFIPTVYNADVMGDEFLHRFPRPNRVLLVRGNLSRATLPQLFTQFQIPYDAIEVYTTTFNHPIKAQLNQLIVQQAFDVITFTSPSAVKAFVTLASSIATLRDLPIGCIGTTTEKMAQSLGFTCTITPTCFTIEHMVEALGNYLTKKGSS